MDAVISPRMLQAVNALKDGRYGTALKIAKSMLKSDPQDAYLCNLAGSASIQLGQPRAAASYFLSASRFDPEMVEAQRNLGQALIMLGETGKAAIVLDRALRKWPSDADLRYQLARAYFVGGQDDRVIEAADQGLAQRPTSADLHLLRALTLERCGNAHEADKGYQIALSLDPHDPEARCVYAKFLMFQARIDVAVDQIEGGLAAHPDHPALLLQKASLQQALGHSERAMACYDTVLRADPNHPIALNGLAFLVSGQRVVTVRKQIEKLLRQTAIDPEIKVLLRFASAHLAKLNDATDAAKILAQANAGAAKLLPYDMHEEFARDAKVMAPFLSGIPVENDRSDMPAPIFVVGLIRSGTTLAERILSSHPNVTGLGELDRAGALATAQGNAFDEHSAPPNGTAFAADYRAGLPDLPNHTTHFIDKMPDNYRVLGYLLNAFPNATILEMQRDPRDVALSMWQNFFPTKAHSYSNAMPSIAAHMNQYARVMQMWHSRYTDRIHQISYADLVTDLHTTARHMATVCGVEWHEDMAAPHRNKAAVLTASFQQVRKPVNTLSLEKWRSEPDLLAPLIAGLDPDLWPMIQR